MQSTVELNEPVDGAEKRPVPLTVSEVEIEQVVRIFDLEQVAVTGCDSSTDFV